MSWLASCNLCGISCPKGSMAAHIAGSKHQAKLRGGGGGSSSSSTRPCFYFANGTCYKGANCSYSHAGSSGSAPAPPPAPAPRTMPPPLSPGAGSQPPPPPPPSSQPAPLAPRAFLNGTSVFNSKYRLLKPVAAPPPLPEHYRDLLKRKQGVNLYITGGKVVWQFAYNVSVIAAIKAHIKGRQWEPSLPPKGCWTCPLESLPDAIRLYEHLGRTPDAALKSRAKQVSDAHGGGSVSDLLSLSVHLLDGEDLPQDVLGRVLLSFQYDADVIAAIKQLAPIQRSYNAQTREWPVDLLALPELLCYLAPLGYTPSPPLKALADVCERLNGLLYQPEVFPADDDSNSSPACLPCGSVPPAPPPLDAIDEDLSDEALLALDVDAIIASSQASQAMPGDQKENQGGSSSQQLPPPASEPPPKPEEEKGDGGRRPNEKLLNSALRELQGLVMGGEGGDASAAIDRSDCGRAKKKRKLTEQQKRWARGDVYGDAAFIGDALDDDSDDDSHLGNYGLWIAGLARRRLLAPIVPAAVNSCDCGQPWRLKGGRHICRYFGYFDCGRCHKRWTSAYCWEGERQACRACNQESLPYKKEKLDGRPGMGNGKPHDSSRCSMCAQLGYDCSM